LGVAAPGLVVGCLCRPYAAAGDLDLVESILPGAGGDRARQLRVGLGVPTERETLRDSLGTLVTLLGDEPY